MADAAREIVEAILSAILRDDATSYADVLAIIAAALDRARAEALERVRQLEDVLFSCPGFHDAGCQYPFGGRCECGMAEWSDRANALYPPHCTRYVAGEGRHRLQASCPLAPAVPCAPEEE